jgi:hypothetical protein
MRKRKKRVMAEANATLPARFHANPFSAFAPEIGHSTHNFNQIYGVTVIVAVAVFVLRSTGVNCVASKVT